MSEDQGRKISDTSFKLEVYSRLNELRHEENFCDVSLSVEGRIFPANKIVLAAASEYFFGLFSSDYVEKTSSVIKIEALSAYMMEQVLNYMYTGDIIIDFSNAKEIVMAADYLIMPSLKNLGSSILLQSLSSHNCIDLNQFATRYCCREIIQRSSECMLEKFENASLTEYFKQLDFETLETLIKEDDLEVEREENVLDRVLEWVKHDIPSREEYLPQLLQALRLFSMSKESLEEYLEEESLIKDNAACTSILKEGLDKFLFPDLTLNTYQKARNCVKESHMKVAVIVGGHIARMKPIPRMIAYALPNGGWYEMGDIKIPDGRSRHCAAVCGSTIIILGGVTGRRMVEIKVTDKIVNSLVTVEVFTSTRHSAIVSLRESLYLFGGEKIEGSEGELKVINHVAVTSPLKINRWKKLAPMSCPRMAHCAVLVGTFVYVIGGCCGDEVYQSGERYDIDADEWMPIAAMNQKRCHAAGANLRGKVFIAGGYPGGEWVAYDSCELYDPETDQWEMILSMPVPRAACGIAQVDDDIFLFGGERDATPSGKLDSVVRYNNKDKSWEEVAKMPVARSCLQVCIFNLPKGFLVPLQ